MSEIFLHNTLSGKREPLRSLRPNQVGLYVCGITPYDEAHLGHGRCYVVFDLLKRVLTKNGYDVKHVQNFTDVDDKIIDRAHQLNKDHASFAAVYIESFHKWMKALNVIPAHEYPHVTTHMPHIVRLIETLIKNGLAYEIEGNVFYAVRKFPAYGQLSKRKLDELESGSRVEVNEKKNDPLDFALWKKAKLNEPAWESPWGKGRPGWHIECSAMSMEYLGEEFDIHGGGLDLIFPHHENEIAQSVGATGKPFAHTWVHNGFVTINQEKMSKSLGNFFTLKDIFATYSPMTVRYFLLAQHYRSPLNYSDQELKAADTVWSQRICEAFRLSAAQKKSPPPEEAQKLEQEFNGALRSDLNTAGAYGALNQLCSLIFKAGDKSGGYHGILATMLNTLGLVVPAEEKGDARAVQLLKDRQDARAKKDYAASDKIRDELKSIGYAIEDTPQGPRLKKIS